MTPDLCKLHSRYIYQIIEVANTKRPRYNWRILTWLILVNVTTIMNLISLGGESDSTSDDSTAPATQYCNAASMGLFTGSIFSPPLPAFPSPSSTTALDYFTASASNFKTKRFPKFSNLQHIHTLSLYHTLLLNSSSTLQKHFHTSFILKL